jgi:predicted RNase H-like nuclease
MTDQIKLAGVDLAWNSAKNPSAIAIGSLGSDGLTVLSVYPAVLGIDEVFQILSEAADLSGIAVDAPLIINNSDGQRLCEREIGVTYGSRNASCHPSNTSLYPNANSVELSNKLSRLGFSHMNGRRWQIECYPHPAIIEIFDLKERLKYKKGRVQEKKAGQIELARLINLLSSSPILKLTAGDLAARYGDAKNIELLKGRALKSNEDALDAIICLYIAALHYIGCVGRTFGNVTDGYIWVPQRACV